MINSYDSIVANYFKQQRPDPKQASALFSQILAGQYSEVQIAVLLTLLHQVGESEVELTAAAQVMRQLAVQISAPADAIDIVGTGGDQLKTLNISSATALLVASGGITVAKHGNRGHSSPVGAADVLEQLGININLAPELTEQKIREFGFGFMLAPIYHPNMRHVAAVRKQLGFPTIFNILGPLCNPAQVKKYLLGCYSNAVQHLMANSLMQLGNQRSWLVHAENGMDELNLLGNNQVLVIDGMQLTTLVINGAEISAAHNFARGRLEDLAGKDQEYNARAIRNVLSNHLDPEIAGGNNFFRDHVVLNAAAAFVITERVASINDGIGLAQQLINSGKAKAFFERLIASQN